MASGSSKKKSINPGVALYRLLRGVLGHDISDAELARQWGMDKKSFWRLKHGKTLLPDIEKMDRLAEMLGTTRQVVMAVGGGLPWEDLVTPIRTRNEKEQMLVLARWASAGIVTPTGPEYLKGILFDSLSEPVLGIDTRGTILACNHACRDLFGHPPEDIIGKSKDFLYASKSESRKATTRMRRAIVERAPFREVFRFRHKDGSVFEAELSGRMVLDSHGTPWAEVGVLRDPNNSTARPSGRS